MVCEGFVRADNAYSVEIAMGPFMEWRPMIASFFTWIQFFESASRLGCFMGRKSSVATTEEPRDRIQVLQN